MKEYAPPLECCSDADFHSYSPIVGEINPIKGVVFTPRVSGLVGAANLTDISAR
jgi:hypothetical protein